MKRVDLLRRQVEFPISRDPPEGGTQEARPDAGRGQVRRFQFLGIPPKGEQKDMERVKARLADEVSNF